MKKITITVLVSLFFQISFGQKNYLPGYIIRNNGDTLRGFIDYRNRELNPDKIYFKENLRGKRTEYTPMNCKSFRVLDEYYAGAIVTTEISPDDSRQLDDGPELKLRTDTTFLQAMISGKKSIYFYMNKFGNEQFYIRNDSSFELLIRKKYKKNTGNQTLVFENKKYIGQLAIYLHDCPTIQKQLEKTEYRKKSIEDLFLYYYNCNSSGIKFQKKTEKSRVEFGVLAGMSMTKLNIKSNDFSYTSDPVHSLSMNFTGGLFLEIIFPRNRGKWSLCNELTYSNFSENGTMEEYTDASRYNITTSTLGYSYIKLNNLLRFKYPVGRFSLFLNAGISNGFVIAEKNTARTISTFYTIKSVYEGKAIADTRKWELGFLCGAGAKYKRFSLEFRYESGNGMSDRPNIVVTANRYSFLLGFRF